MNLKALLLLAWIAKSGTAFCVLPEDTKEYMIWENKILESISQQEFEPTESALDKLGLWMIQLNPNDSINKERGDAPVFKAAQSMALSKFRHADYFGKKITGSYELIKKGYAEGKQAGELPWHYHLSESRKAFTVLSLLPSHETVHVLGEMLSDEWKWPGYEEKVHWESIQDTLDIRAVSALAKLPIANGPTKPLYTAEDMRDNVDAWKVWYQEIKDGRRTFRFKGDPVHYDLRGPSKRGEVFPNTSRAGKRIDTSGETGASESPERQASRFLPYLLGFLFVAAGLVYYFKKRQRMRKFSYHT